MTDFSSKLQDREWVADLIRRTEQAAASLSALLEVLYKQRETGAEKIVANQEVLYLDQWRHVSSSVRCTVNGGWHLHFSDGSFTCCADDASFLVRDVFAGCETEAEAVEQAATDPLYLGEAS